MKNKNQGKKRGSGREEIRREGENENCERNGNGGGKPKIPDVENKKKEGDEKEIGVYAGDTKETGLLQDENRGKNDEDEDEFFQHKNLFKGIP